MVLSFKEREGIEFILPGFNDRVVVNGRTGSGKTQASTWLLANMDFDIPWVIVDFKREGLFASSRYIRPIDLDTSIPTDGGLYIIRPFPFQQEDVEKWLWKVWKQKNIGLYVDEAYLLPDKEAFRTILTTGRSRRIPVISVSQRPVYLPRFVFSEANFYMIFHLNDMRDHKTVRQFVPNNEFWELDKRLPKYVSRWYDVERDLSFKILPAPDARQIIETIDAKLRPLHRWV